MRLITILYFLLLFYIIAALLFWGVSLHKQNQIILHHELQTLHLSVDSTQYPEQYKSELQASTARASSRTNQYVGEGATFLIIILIGAGVVYSSVRSNHKLSRQQNNFMLSITHELKSPIAAIKLNLQTLAKRQLEHATQQQLIERSIKEANRLNDLCNNLLLASQMESNRYKPAEERIEISEIATECLDEVSSRSKHRFVAHIDEGCFTMGDRLLWKLAINNLLENAVKYSPIDTTITLSLHQNDDEIILKVEDEGIGISDEEKSKIFDKFYRVGNEESRKTKGTGLGLYLTAKIVNRHKASISVTDNTPKGSVFEITMNTA
jgi:signal transduction histidine kinase